MQTRTYADRWQYQELFNFGYLVVPAVFLRNYNRLEPHSLTHAEAVFVLHLMEFKWDRSAPFPSYNTLAKRMGISTKTVRRYAHSLQKKGLIRLMLRAGHRIRFDLGPLFEKLREEVKKLEIARRDGRDDEEPTHSPFPSTAGIPEALRAVAGTRGDS